MRLNFSGCDEESIREGVRRIGEVVTEQMELYGTLTGEHRAAEPAPAAPEPAAEVLRMPTPEQRERRSTGR
jgi:2-aminoadipate transaminase